MGIFTRDLIARGINGYGSHGVRWGLLTAAPPEGELLPTLPICTFFVHVEKALRRAGNMVCATLGHGLYILSKPEGAFEVPFSHRVALNMSSIAARTEPVTKDPPPPRP